MNTKVKTTFLKKYEGYKNEGLSEPEIAEVMNLDNTLVLRRARHLCVETDEHAAKRRDICEKALDWGRDGALSDEELARRLGVSKYKMYEYVNTTLQEKPTINAIKNALIFDLDETEMEEEEN